MPNQINQTPRCDVRHIVTQGIVRKPPSATAQVSTGLLEGVPKQDDLEPDPAPAEPWADEDLERFYAEYVEEFDEQDALEGTDLPICDEGSCPVETCPFSLGAGGLSYDELIDAMASCELSTYRAEKPHGIPGLVDALGGAGWPVYRVTSE